MISARNIKRVIRRWCVWRQTLPRLEREYRPIVERMLGGTVTWQQAGGRGRDVIVLVKLGGSPSAFLRLVAAPDKTIKPHAPGLPFVALDAAAKLEREWHAYAQAAPLGLAPTPLWRDQHAMLSAYVDGTPLTQAARRRGGAALSATLAAMPAIAALHATGLTHMDMSLANILRRRDDGKLLFIDFEHGAAAGLQEAGIAVVQRSIGENIRPRPAPAVVGRPEQVNLAEGADMPLAAGRHHHQQLAIGEPDDRRPAMVRVVGTDSFDFMNPAFRHCTHPFRFWTPALRM